LKNKLKSPRKEECDTLLLLVVVALHIVPWLCGFSAPVQSQKVLLPLLRSSLMFLQLAHGVLCCAEIKDLQFDAAIDLIRREEQFVAQLQLQQTQLQQPQMGGFGLPGQQMPMQQQLGYAQMAPQGQLPIGMMSGLQQQYQPQLQQPGVMSMQQGTFA
jgi:hypothetical protein